MHEGAWSHPSGFPTSRSRPPVTVEINGRAIFAKGSNWVSTDIFPGRVTAETLQCPWFSFARDANFNILRCWGGAIVNPEPFFERCDELGILVWQEFPLACNNYPDDKAYLGVLNQESRSIIRRLRHAHPASGYGGGGNELFQFLVGDDTDQSLALRAPQPQPASTSTPRPRSCPRRPSRDWGTATTGSATNGGARSTRSSRLRRTRAIPSSDAPVRLPRRHSGRSYPRLSYGLRAREEAGRPTTPSEHGKRTPRLGSCRRRRSTASARPTTSKRWSTAETGSSAQDTRPYSKRRGDRSRAARWRSTGASTRRGPRPPASTIVKLAGVPAKDAMPASFTASCRPVLASARFAKFQWKAGEEFSAEIWMLNDAPAPLPAGEVEVILACGGSSTRIALWTHPEIAAGRSLLRAAGPRGAAALRERGIRGHPQGGPRRRLELHLPPKLTCRIALRKPPFTRRHAWVG